MNRITNHLSEFLFTEHRSEDKPYLLSFSEQLLSQATALTNYKYTWIDEKGRPINTGGEYRWNEYSKKQSYFIAFPIFCGYLAICAFNQSPLLAALAYTACSFTAKCLSDIVLSYKGRFKKNVRWTVGFANIIAITPIAFAPFSIIAAGVCHVKNTGMLRANVLFIACYALNILGGALLKYATYKTYPKVQNLFNCYFAYLKIPRILFNPQVPQQQSSFLLPSEVFYFLIQFLPLKDIENLISCNRDLSQFLSPCKIQKNFSREFICLVGSLDKKFFLSDENSEEKALDLGMKRILQILQLSPLPTNRFSRLEDNLTHDQIDFLLGSNQVKYQKNCHVLFHLMEHIHIGWGRGAQGDIFLCFKNENGFMLVMAHQDSFKISENPICKELATNWQTYEIYFDSNKLNYFFRNTRKPDQTNEEPLDIEKFTVFLFGSLP